MLCPQLLKCCGYKFLLIKPNEGHLLRRTHATLEHHHRRLRACVDKGSRRNVNDIPNLILLCNLLAQFNTLLGGTEEEALRKHDRADATIRRKCSHRQLNASRDLVIVLNTNALNLGVYEELLAHASILSLNLLCVGELIVLPLALVTTIGRIHKAVVNGQTRKGSTCARCDCICEGVGTTNLVPTERDTCQNEHIQKRRGDTA